MYDFFVNNTRGLLELSSLKLVSTLGGHEKICVLETQCTQFCI